MKEKCKYIILVALLLLSTIIKYAFFVSNILGKHILKQSGDKNFKVQVHEPTQQWSLAPNEKKKVIKQNKKSIILQSTSQDSIETILKRFFKSCHSYSSYCFDATKNKPNSNNKRPSNYPTYKCDYKVTQIPSSVETFMVAITFVKLVVIVFAYKQLLNNGYSIIQNLYQKHFSHFELLVCSRPYQVKFGHGQSAEENLFGCKYQKYQKRQPLKIRTEGKLLEQVNNIIDTVARFGKDSNDDIERRQQYLLIKKEKSKKFKLQILKSNYQLYHQHKIFNSCNFYQEFSYNHHRRLQYHQNHSYNKFYFHRNNCCIFQKGHFYNKGSFHQLEKQSEHDSQKYSKVVVGYEKTKLEDTGALIFLLQNSLVSAFSKSKKTMALGSLIISRTCRLENIPNYHATVPSLTSFSSTICCWKATGNRKRRKRKCNIFWDKNEYIRNCQFNIRDRSCSFSCCYLYNCYRRCDYSASTPPYCCHSICQINSNDCLGQKAIMRYKFYNNEFDISSHDRILKKSNKHKIDIIKIANEMRKTSNQASEKWCIETSEHDGNEVSESNLLRSLNAVKDNTSPVQNRSTKRKLKKNLVWLFIGLVWLEGPKLINCSISHNNNDVTSLNGNETTNKIENSQGSGENSGNSSDSSGTRNGSRNNSGSSSNTNGPGTNARSDAADNKGQKPRSGPMETDTNHIYTKIQSHFIQNKISIERPAQIETLYNYQTFSQNEGTQQREPYIVSITNNSPDMQKKGRSPSFFESEEANRAQSDLSRLESIKRQILTKLGLTEKPNVTHPLPKQFIWDTIYRADGIRSVRDFDFNDYRRTQEQMRLATAVLEPPPLLSYHYGGTENVIALSKENENRTDTNSDVKAVSRESGIDFSPGKDLLSSRWKLLNLTTEKMERMHQKYQRKFKEQHQQQKSRNNKSSIIRKKNKSVEPDFIEGDDFFGSTQEIITFAEKGKVYRKHRLVEFSPPSNKIPKQKLQIRNAEIHIRIEKVPSDPGKSIEKYKRRNLHGHKLKSSREPSLKIWIFQLIENDFSSKGFDQVARLCTSLSVDHNVLGWQKLDITETVQFWYGKHQRDKLRLLIDCTGCGNRYILHLFDRKFHHAIFSPSIKTNLRGKLYDAQENKTKKNNNSTDRPNHLDTDISPHYFYHYRRYSHHRYRRKNRTSQTEKVFEKIGEIPSQFKNDKQGSYPHSFWFKSKMHRKNREIQKQSISREELQGISYEVATEFHLEDRLNPNIPFLVLHTEPTRSRRVRRRAVDCSGALHGQCCKESFYVSFKALGWDDWIIAPRGYFANYCRGDCTGPFRTPDTFQTFHAHFIEEYRKMGLLNGMQPCCAPVKFSSMSLIYYGDDGIIKRDLPKMVVDECGCP